MQLGAATPLVNALAPKNRMSHHARVDKRKILSAAFVVTTTACGSPPEAQQPANANSGPSNGEPIATNPPGPDGQPGIGDGAGPIPGEPGEGQLEAQPTVNPPPPEQPPPEEE